MNERNKSHFFSHFIIEKTKVTLSFAKIGLFSDTREWDELIFTYSCLLTAHLLCRDGKLWPALIKRRPHGSSFASQVLLQKGKVSLWKQMSITASSGEREGESDHVSLLCAASVPGRRCVTVWGCAYGERERERRMQSFHNRLHHILNFPAAASSPLFFHTHLISFLSLSLIIWISYKTLPSLASVIFSSWWWTNSLAFTFFYRFFFPNE